MAKQIYKTRVKQGLTIDKNLYKTMDNHSKSSRIPKSQIIDMALELYFKNNNIEIIKEDAENN